MNLYVLRNKEGKFFRSKGYGGYGNSWVDTLEKAKFYTKIGPAKAQVTYWYGNHPAFGCPDLLEFTLDPTKATVIDMKAVTEAATQKRLFAEAKRAAADRKWRVEQAERELERAQAHLKTLRCR